MRAIAQDRYGAADALGVETRPALRGQIGRETVKTIGRSIFGQQKAGGLAALYLAVAYLLAMQIGWFAWLGFSMLRPTERSEQPLPIKESFA
jgi:hypothetical protein